MLYQNGWSYDITAGELRKDKEYHEGYFIRGCKIHWKKGRDH